MNKNKIIVILLTLTLLGGYRGLTPKNSTVLNEVVTPISDFEECEVTESTPFYLDNYKNIEELSAESTLVVKGTIVETISYEKQIGTLGKRTNPFIYTNVTVRVSDVIKGETEYKDLKFRIQGGKVDTRIMLMGENPFIKKDSEVILFLTKYQDNLVTVMGGPQGRFHIQDSKVYSIGEYDEYAAESTKALHQNGETLERFIQEIS